MFQQLGQQVKSLTALLERTRLQDEWPDLQLVATCNSKEVAICKLNPKQFIYSQREETTGQQCGKSRTFHLKVTITLSFTEIF